MYTVSEPFEYEYRGCDIVYGRDSVSRIGEYLGARGLSDALLVCGSNVGANEELLDPIEFSINDRLAGVFDETSSEKRVETAFDLIDRIEQTNADVLIAVGGGSSLDIARQASVLTSDNRSLSDFEEESRSGTVTPPHRTGETIPVIVVPTTFTGADASSGGSLELLSAADSPTEQPVRISGSAMPIADFVDPSLFETTPTNVLLGSAMNGFNKGIETLYARDSNPVSDATAVHGLRLLSESLPEVAAADGLGSKFDQAGSLDRAVVGSLLVQLDRKISIVHAFGHGFTRRYSVQQGAVHAAVVPHVLEYLFEEVDASRSVLAMGVGVDPTGKTDEELANAIVTAVTEVRDSIGAPKQLRELPETRAEDLPAIAEFIVDDSPMDRVPVGLEPSASDVETVLGAAW